MPEEKGTRVLAGEVAKNFGRYQEMAQFEPVVVRRYNRDSVVILSAREFARLSKLDRKVVAIEEISQSDLELLSDSRMDERHARLNALLEE